jgi:hypothetical protein
MEWLEQNLDAYRIIAEILNDLREVLREELEAIHGKTWYKIGLPDGLLERLIEIKEEEKAIDWYESEYQQIMTYAVFPDLLEILEHGGDSFPHIMRLAPTTALLHARFLELEVMRSKLGRARPISDTELAFLGTFHLRFRKAIDEFRSQGPARREAAAAGESPPVPEEAAAGPKAVSESAAPAAEPAATTGPPQRGAQTPGEETEEESPILDDSDALGAMADEDTSAKEPQGEEEGEGEGEGEGEQEEEKEAEEPAELEADALEAALEEGNNRVILRALYQEVTNTAESIWGKDVLPASRVWNKVSTSSWYEENFSPLGLRAVSDYYEIISKVDDRMRSGVAKEELQEYLKDSNFAQILLALRDMFQRNQI